MEHSTDALPSEDVNAAGNYPDLIHSHAADVNAPRSHARAKRVLPTFRSID